MKPNNPRPHFQNIKLKLRTIKLRLPKKFIRIRNFDSLVYNRFKRLCLQDSIYSDSSLTTKRHETVYTLSIFIQQAIIIAINKAILYLSANGIH